MALKKRSIGLIYATSRNGVIGREGTLPWKCSSDLAEFKRLTLGATIIMGRKTWESLPKKPLSDRQNIVVTRNRNYVADGAEIASSLEDAFALANNHKVLIIGGGSLYEQGLKYAHTIYETIIDVDVEDGDTFAPSEEVLNQMGFVHQVSSTGLARKEGEPNAVLRIIMRKYEGDPLVSSK